MERKTKWIAGGALALALIGGGTGVAVAGDVVGGDDDAPLTGSTLDDATAAALAETGGGTVTDTEHDDGRYEVEITLDDGTQRDVTLDDTFAVVGSEADDADDVALTGATLEQATAAALAETGGGTVTDSEQEANGGYEVEVTLDDGTDIDVHLDDNFEVTGTDTDDDDDETNDDDETDDDDDETDD